MPEGVVQLGPQLWPVTYTHVTQTTTPRVFVITKKSFVKKKRRKVLLTLSKNDGISFFTLEPSHACQILN